ENPLTRVSWMAVQVYAESSGGAFLEFNTLQFLDYDPRTLGDIIGVEEGWDNCALPLSSFRMVDLSSLANASARDLLPRLGIGLPWFATNQVCAGTSVPFALAQSDKNLFASTMYGNETLEIPLNGTATEAYLLLATRLVGTRNFWPEEGPNAPITDPESLVAEIVYADGEVDEVFPVDIYSRRHEVPGTNIAPLIIPIEANRALRALRLHDRMHFGLIALAALTLREGPPLFVDAFAEPSPVVVPELPAPSSLNAPQSWVENGNVHLGNSWMETVWSTSSGLGLSHLVHEPLGRDLLSTSPVSIFRVEADGVTFSSLDCSVNDVVVTQALSGSILSRFGLSAPSGIPLALEFEVELGASSDALMRLSIRNVGGDPLDVRAWFPTLGPLRIAADSRDDTFLFPHDNPDFFSEEITVSHRYGVTMPFQFLDVFNNDEGAGAWLMTRDQNLRDKLFTAQKTHDGTLFEVMYTSPSVARLAPGGQFPLAEASVGVHIGDWHAAFDAYRSWVASWYQPHGPLPARLRETFFCRRDYPIYGSDKLFDRDLNQFTMDRSIDDSERWIATPDFLDISGWESYGNYLLYRIGGKENLAENIALAAACGVPVGLYLHGFYVSATSQVGLDHGEEWGIRRQDGTLLADEGIAMCPYDAAWREWYAGVYEQVATDTGASGLYLDVFNVPSEGYRCWATNHGHGPGAYSWQGERDMIRQVRETLNRTHPNVALYTEFIPTDLTAPWQDGAFSYGVIRSDLIHNPSRTTLFRFVFPQLKTISLNIGGVTIKNFTVSGPKAAFFNGEGLWLKGDHLSWNDATIRAFTKLALHRWRENRDAFTSQDLTPLIPTLRGGLSAHRFATADKQIYTLMNTGWVTMRGEGLRVTPPFDARAVDLLRSELLGEADAGEALSIPVDLAPHDVGCVAIYPRRLTAQIHDDLIVSGHTDLFEGEKIEIVAQCGDHWDRHVVETQSESGSFELDLRSILAPIPDKVELQITLDGNVRDLIPFNTAAFGTGWSVR
ncbi:MAG: DUF6259 domain-containing protein, partial [bacterium]